MYGGDTGYDGKMSFAGACSANQDQVVRCFQTMPPASCWMQFC